MPASFQEQLMIRQLSGTISPEEQKALLRWLQENPEHQKAFDDFQQVWKLSEAKAVTPNFNTQQEWQRLEVSLDELDQPAVKERSLPGRDWGWLKIAASVAFLLSCAAVFFLLNRDPELIVKESGTAEIYLTLSDGSEVWLNRGSSIRYPEEFEGDERLVELSGEAFFKVAHNPEKPFIVLADKAKVKVLGTSFNVKAYPQTALAEVFVLTGKVGLSAVAAEAQLVLKPGDKGVLTKAQNLLSIEQTEVGNILAWREKKLVFKKAALGEVISTLEDYFNVKIQVANPALLHCRFSSSFNDPALEEVLEVLRHSLNISIEGEGGNFRLVGEGCKANEA